VGVAVFVLLRQRAAADAAYALAHFQHAVVSAVSADGYADAGSSKIPST
jgi:hypothetical protein